MRGKFFSFDEQRHLPQGLAKSRTGEVSNEENSTAIDANIENMEKESLPTGTAKMIMSKIHQQTNIIMMICMCSIIAMHGVETIEVDTLTEEQKEKTSAGVKSKQTKLRLKRGITMDSGAGNNVMPRRMVIKKSEIRDSEGSRRGVHYVAANDGRIPNEGEYDLKFSTVEGQEQCLTFQIAEVNKALCAISNLVDNGFRVVFDKNMKTNQDISHMLHKESGVTTRYRRTRNVWVLDAFVDGNSDNKDQSFHRRG